MDVLTSKEAATLLKLKSPDKIYLLLRGGLIRGFKFGNRWLIDKDSLDRFCLAQTGQIPVSDKDSDTLLRSSRYIGLPKIP